MTRGELKFENVAFGYHPDRPIFRDVSFTVPGGQKVAIVGPSGSGKSTTFRLLFRMYDPSAGRITIDGQDIRDVDLDTLRRAIGVVPQDTPLFHSDIMHNIRYGRLDASDAEVVEAARKANVLATIEGLPDKWKTKVGERGLMISGGAWRRSAMALTISGEKQRLAVARLLLKDSPILFFDEATSALDTYTETDLIRNVNATLLDKHRTSVFIAHRLKTIADAGASSRSAPRLTVCRPDHCHRRRPRRRAGLTSRATQSAARRLRSALGGAAAGRSAQLGSEYRSVRRRGCSDVGGSPSAHRALVVAGDAARWRSTPVGRRSPRRRISPFRARPVH